MPVLNSSEVVIRDGKKLFRRFRPINLDIVVDNGNIGQESCTGSSDYKIRRTPNAAITASIYSPHEEGVLACRNGRNRHGGGVGAAVVLLFQLAIFCPLPNNIIRQHGQHGIRHRPRQIKAVTVLVHGHGDLWGFWGRQFQHDFSEGGHVTRAVNSTNTILKRSSRAVDVKEGSSRLLQKLAVNRIDLIRFDREGRLHSRPLEPHNTVVHLG